MIVTGTSGSGKSRFLTGLAKQLLDRSLHAHGQGLVLIDPVGDIYTALRSYQGARCLRSMLAERSAPPALARRIRERREKRLSRVMMLDLCDLDCGGWRFNPLEVQSGMSVAETVGDLLRVMERLLGDMSDMRRLLNMLRCSCTLLAEMGGATLRDAIDIIFMSSDELHAFLDQLERRRERHVRMRPSLVHKYMRDFLASVNPRDRRDLTQSTFNALSMVLTDERTARFLGSPTGNLDLGKLVQEGNSLLVNAPSGLDLKTSRLISSCIVNRVELLCRRRDVERVKAGLEPAITLLVDEFQNCISQEWSDTISQVRNYALQLIVSHQTASQRNLGDTPEGEALLRTVRANASCHVYFRLALVPDARDAAEIVFRPEGKRLKREAVDRSESRSWSASRARARTVTESLTMAFSMSEATSVTVAIGEGRSASVSKARGITRVETDTFTVAMSDTWSRCTSHNLGVTVTQSDSETFLEAAGRSTGNSSSEAQTMSESHSDGVSTGHFDGSGFSLPVGMESLAAGQAAGGRPHQSSTQGLSRSHSQNRSHGQARSLAQAISRVDTVAQSLALGHSTGRSESRTTGESRTEGSGRTESQGRALAHGLSQVETALRSLSQTLTQSRGRTQTQGVTRSHGRSTGQTETATRAQGRTVGITRRDELYSVTEETTLRAYELASLPPRHAWVLLNGTEAVRIRTYDVPDRWTERLGPVDGRACLEAATAPPPVPGEPADPVHERLRGEMSRGAAHLSFIRPGDTPGGEGE